MYLTGSVGKLELPGKITLRSVNFTLTSIIINNGHKK